jgi:hypothetical protein
MEVDANVSEADISEVVLGNESSFTVEAFPGRVFQGRVVQVRQAPQSAQQLSGMQASCVRDDDRQRIAALVYNLVSTTVHTELLAQESARPDRAQRARVAEDIWEFCQRAIIA